MGKIHQFDWQNGAACKGVPLYVFFADEARPDAKSDPYADKTYHDFCGMCLVKFKCREFANLHDMQGTWGDLTEKERSKVQSAEDREYLRDYKEETGEYWPLYGHA